MKRLSLLSLAAAVALAGCQTASSDTVKIGFVGPLTGDVAGLGIDILNGATMAMDKINAAGGVGGKKIEIIAEDGKCSGGDAASAAQKLVNVDKVLAMMTLCSGETLASAAIAEAGKVVILSPVSSSPDVTKAGDFVFRNYPSDALKTKAMAKYFASEGITKVAMITENTDFSQGFRASLKKDLPEGTIVFDEVVEPGTKDYRTLMTRLKDVEFDVFFPNGNSDGVIGPMLQQMREAGLKQTVIGHDAADSAAMAKAVPESEGLYVINVASGVKDPSFTGNFEKKYGDPKYGIAFAGYGYDAVEVIADGVSQGATTGEMLRDWLYKMPKVTGVSGTFSFDANGDVVGIPYVLKQFKNGAIETLKDIAVD